jgi:hypothetical protein
LYDNNVVFNTRYAVGHAERLMKIKKIIRYHEPAQAGLVAVARAFTRRAQLPKQLLKIHQPAWLP